MPCIVGVLCYDVGMKRTKCNYTTRHGCIIPAGAEVSPFIGGLYLLVTDHGEEILFSRKEVE